MRKPLLNMLFVLLCFAVKGQETVIRKGLLKGMATISPSKMLAYNESYFYLHGNLEGYLNDNVSVSGEGYMFLGEQSSAPQSFKYMHNVFFGANYHFIKGNGDFHLGLQPGACFAQLNTDSVKVPVSHMGVSPVFSAILGYNFFVGKHFNFFIQTRYIAGQHNYDWHKSLSEIRLSAGLGFNINTLKRK